MCFYTAQNAPAEEVEERFDAIIDSPEDFLVSEYINGYAFLNLPIIKDVTPKIITTNYHWGLVPSWANDIDFRKNTLNARIESIEDKPSFRDVISNRCLIIATSFFEWHWNDEKGKSKDKYQIVTDNNIFAFAGLYTTWKDKQTGDDYHSYTMVTTEANETMKYIHNHKKRMPIVLKKADEMAWLDSNNDIQDFAYPYQSNLVGFQV